MWRWIKVPKGIALVCFFLPWLTVSCSSQVIAEASGWNMATGRVALTNPITGVQQTQNGDANTMLIVALIVIALGLIATFLPRRTGALATLATSALGAGLIWAATYRISQTTFEREMDKIGSSERLPAGMDVTKLIRLDWQYGFWLTLLGLVVAGVMAWLVFTGRDAALLARLRRTARPDAAADAPEDMASSEGETSETDRRPLLACPSCGRRFPPGTRFCPDDSTRIA